MSTDAGVFLILAMHHRHCIPANQRFDAALHFAIAGIGQLLLYGNRVLVRRIELRGRVYARLARAPCERLEHFGGPARALFFDDLIEGLKPLGNFALISLHRLSRRNWICVHNYHDITCFRPPF